eukprot:TRINITY_DN10373_c0_g1_i1.p2 TRINITY_DN10373_c0_g1~~TRINITY_DN10373_c0_g1_i1.p2  ORF type:complete len:114 (+),score=45.19 TRINITY_DN10373_c0_g1_i1:41-382(+)
MGCFQSNDEEEDEQPQQPSRGYTPTPKADMDLDAILNMNKVDVNNLPDGFPPAPKKTDKFEGGGEDEYKEWMRQRMKYEKWENSLTLYKMREKDGNTEACQQIVERLNAELNE